MNIDVFISHHTDSSLHIVEGIVNKLEAIGIRCWYAPRNTEGAYASSIAKALNNCEIFLLILNRPASESFHVLNEIDMVCKRLANNEEVKILPFHIADDEITQDAQYYIGRIHWIDAMTPPMYQRIDELVERIADLLGKDVYLRESQNKDTGQDYRLIGKLPQAREIFNGREDLITKIHEKFLSGKRALFLEGIGGIGKSELAKQYALRYKDDYENILFVTYETSLEKLFYDSSAIVIKNLEPEQGEEEGQYFRRKLKILQNLTDEKTLLIIDNFDADTDPRLMEFLEGNYRVIFTTRNTHSGYSAIKVEAIHDIDILFEIFEQNYGITLSAEDRPYIEKIFEKVEYHTYTIELIAKQMEASFLGAQEMLEILSDRELRNRVSETVAGRKDRKTAFEHICSVYNVSKLSEEEKKVMMYLSMVGIQGIPAVRFRQWAELTSFETINQLIRKSWVRKESGQKISLHPLVKDVVCSMLNPSVETCRSFLENITVFCFRAWFRNYEENLAVAGNVLAVLEYFKIPDGRELEIFEPYISFLWQVGKFDDAIQYSHRLYQSCLDIYGEGSMKTGFAAKSLGGCYFNSRHLKESIPWYHQGLHCMLLSGEPENEDLAMSYEKVGRCYTWECEKDFAKAEENLKMALDIRMKLRAALRAGEKKTMLMKYEDYDLNRAEIRIGESYMELGRMYQILGDYKQALSYVTKQKEILETSCPEDLASIAYVYYDQGVCHYYLGLQEKEQGNTAFADKEWEQAEQKLKEALELNLKRRGPLAIDTMDNQEYLADVYAAMGRYGEASNGYMAVITMAEKLLGKDCERIASVKEKMKYKE